MLQGTVQKMIHKMSLLIRKVLDKKIIHESWIKRV